MVTKVRFNGTLVALSFSHLQDIPVNIQLTELLQFILWKLAILFYLGSAFFNACNILKTSTTCIQLFMDRGGALGLVLQILVK